MKRKIATLLAASAISIAALTAKEQNKFIGMPVGGITSGQLYLGGDGQLWHWDIFNIMSADPGGSGGDRYYLNPLTQQKSFENGFGINIKQGLKVYNRALNADGFSNIEFKGKYPIGQVSYKDEFLPVEVELKSFSPFIPTDIDNSSLPLTVMEYTVTNSDDAQLEVELVGWLQNMSCFQTAKTSSGKHINSTESGDGYVRVNLSSDNHSQKNQRADWGSMSLTLLGNGKASAQCARVVGIPSYFVTDEATSATSQLGEPLVGGVARSVKLEAGESATFTFLVSWYFPNIHLWNGTGVDHWANREDLRHYYSAKFNSSQDVANYVVRHPQLMKDTKLWVDTWYDSSLPNDFLDRTLLNVSTLATVASVRFNDLKDRSDSEGRFYSAEGVYLGDGTCTHVFHYEQALGRLFPSLARQLREQTDLGSAFNYKQNGIIGYRGGEFSGFGQHDGRGYAVDGQAGTILRIYREHLMSPDNSFLASNWDKIKSAMQYMINHDKQKSGKADGILEGAQYNTLDRIWYGKIPWTSGLYAAALRASQQMATAVGDKPFAKECGKIAQLAYDNISGELFDGEYFVQILDKDHLDAPNSNKGCHIDQMLGQYWASQLGLGYIVPKEMVTSSLNSIMKYNFVDNYSEFLSKTPIPISRWYADGNEQGVIMCSFPKGGAHIAPGKINNDWERLVVGYFSEVWTGQEHALAAALISQGLTDKGMKVIDAVNQRYSPQKRNPYNEVEYGNHYTRAMSGYAPFVAASGFFYNGPKGIIKFNPQITASDFKSAFVTSMGWGSYTQKQNATTEHYSLKLEYGNLTLNSISLPTKLMGKASVTLLVNGKQLDVESGNNGQFEELVFDTLLLERGDVIDVELSLK